MSTAEPPDEPARPGAADASADTWSALTTGAVAPPPPSDLLPGAPGAWIADPPKPKRKLTWLWVLLGVLGIITALVVVAVVLFVRTLTGPIDAANRALVQIKAHHYPAAYRLACSEDRRNYSEKQYEQAFIDATTQQGQIKSYDVNYASINGAKAEVRFNIEFVGSGTVRYEASAQKENGHWRVCLLAPDRGAALTR